MSKLDDFLRRHFLTRSRPADDVGREAITLELEQQTRQLKESLVRSRRARRLLQLRSDILRKGEDRLT